MKILNILITILIVSVVSYGGYYMLNHQRIQTVATGIVVEIAVQPDTVYLPGKPAKKMTDKEWLQTPAGLAFIAQWEKEHPADTVFADLIPDSIQTATVDTTIMLTIVVNDSDTTRTQTTLYAEHSYSPFFDDFHYWGFKFGGFNLTVDIPIQDSPKVKNTGYWLGVMCGIERVGVYAGITYKRAGLFLTKINGTPLMGGVAIKF